MFKFISKLRIQLQDPEVGSSWSMSMQSSAKRIRRQRLRCKPRTLMRKQNSPDVKLLLRRWDPRHQKERNDLHRCS